MKSKAVAATSIGSQAVEVWLVRQYEMISKLFSGETFANIQKIIQGQQGGELTPKGVE